VIILRFKVEKLLFDNEVDHICTTSDIKEVEKVCKELDGCDFNTTVYINGKFDDIYMDDEIFEFLKSV